MTDKENNYIERHRHWQDQAINQLSTANNFMLTISIGLLAFCFDKNVFMNIRFCVCSCKIDWSFTLHFFALIFLIVLPVVSLQQFHQFLEKEYPLL